MIYPAAFEQKIGFDRIRTMLKDLCHFQLGKEEVEKICFSADYDVILNHVSLTGEMLAVISDPTLTIPLGAMADLREMLSRIRIEGLFLDEVELNTLRKTLNTSLLLIGFLQQLDSECFPLLNRLPQTTHTSHFQIISKHIDSILDRYGKIKDNASPELAHIRRELTASQGSVSRTLNAILRQVQAEGLVDKDVTPTLREGRLVIPVPPMYKRKIGGIVHDESATGKTVYIEPTAVVEANNHIRELENDERREIINILRETSNLIRPVIPDILDSQAFLGTVDFIHAKACFAKQINAQSPIIQRKPVIEWYSATHPLLLLSLRSKNEEVVPLNIRLDNKHRLLLISGPNAGGKSVCLKTVALLQYMLQCGLLVPLADNSRMGLFKNIFIDIGDEQSIENDLSTYSSHLLNMKYFVKHSNQDTLLLIDEFGTGTEPQIGGAIAQATLERLCQSRAFGVITTHYQNLKHFAQDTEGIVNGAMLYDRQQLRPLFQLSIGKPGSSFAIEIARMTGLPEDIVRKAQELVGTDYTDYDKHLQDIARDKRYWEQKRQTIHEREKELNERIAYYESEIAKLRDTRRQMLEQARQEASALLQQSNATIEHTIQQIKEAQAEKQQTRQARQQIEQLKSRLERRPAKGKNGKTTESEQQSATLVVGCNVRLTDRNMNGIIIELNDKKALVAIGDIKTWIPLNKLEYIEAGKAKRTQQITIRQLNTAATKIQQKTLTFKSTLDVRGMRADEALQAVTYFLDDATMVSAKEVRILHGTGNGILRQIIRDYLPTHPMVVSFKDEHVDFGGAGITVVKLD